MIEETIQSLQVVLDEERQAVMRFDSAACAELAEQKAQLALELEQMLKAGGADIDALRPQLKQLRQRMHSNHALLGFAHSAVRGAIDALTGTPAATIYSRKGGLSAPKASLVRRVV